MAGSRQHRIPATYIGGFGTGSGRARDRKLWVRRRGQEPRPSTANAVNWERGVYTTTSVSDDPEHLEKFWALFEGKLAAAIDTLVSNRPLPWNHVLEHLVPFVAQLCVRTSMYDAWFKQTHPEAVASHPDLLNVTRATLLPSLAGRVMRCSWTVAHGPPETRFITNDLGVAGVQWPTGGRCMVIPLRPDAALLLQRAGKRMWRKVEGGRLALIGRTRFPPGVVHAINEGVASQAWDEIYGRERSDVESMPLAPEATPDRGTFLGALIEDPVEDQQNPPDQEWLAEMERANLKASDVLQLPGLDADEVERRWPTGS